MSHASVISLYKCDFFTMKIGADARINEGATWTRISFTEWATIIEDLKKGAFWSWMIWNMIMIMEGSWMRKDCVKAKMKTPPLKVWITELRIFYRSKEPFLIFFTNMYNVFSPSTLLYLYTDILCAVRTLDQQLLCFQRRQPSKLTMRLATNKTPCHVEASGPLQ